MTSIPCLYHHGDKQLKRKLICLVLTLVVLLAPLSAFAISQQSGSGFKAVTGEVPIVKEYSISASSGEVPITVCIKLTTSSDAQQMRVETEAGEVLFGSESLRRPDEKTCIFTLETAFNTGYEGKLLVYLKNQKGYWINTDIEFSVKYQAKSQASFASAPAAQPRVTSWGITADSGETPVDVSFRVRAFDAKKMRVETERGKILTGSESSEQQKDGSRMFVFKTTFANAYEGMLYVYLMDQNGKWVKTEADYSVCYQEKPLVTSVTEMGLTLEKGEDGCWTVTQYAGKASRLVIPQKVQGIAVTKISHRAFYGCTSLVEVTLPYGIKTIDDEAFSCCSPLQKVYLPASVEQIGERAFYRCQNLEEINIPEGIKSIGDLAFYYCSDLKEITLPKSVNYIGDEAFRRIILQHSHSESREIEKPITFYVYRNSYADNYVKTYHSYDKLKYRK